MSKQQPWYLTAKAAAKSKHITYAQIGAACGVERAAVSHWFSGRNRPRIEQIQKIAEVLGMPLVELIQGDTFLVPSESYRALLESLAELPEKDQEEAFRLLQAWMATRPTHSAEE